VENLDDQGKVFEVCSANDAAEVPARGVPPSEATRTYAPSPPPDDRVRQEGAIVRAPVERESRFVSDSGFVAIAGLVTTSAGSGLTLGVGVHQAWGGRFAEAFGMECVLDAQLLALPAGLLFNVAVAPGLRFGHRSHFVLALGPSLAFLALTNGSPDVLRSLEGTLTMRGVFIVGEGGFGIHLHGGVMFDASGAMFTLGIGEGGSSF
jgi:hypothetical protein